MPRRRGYAPEREPLLSRSNDYGKRITKASRKQVNVRGSGILQRTEPTRADCRQVGRAGRAVKESEPVQQHRRGEDAEEEILRGRLLASRVAAAVGAPAVMV